MIPVEMACLVSPAMKWMSSLFSHRRATRRCLHQRFRYRLPGGRNTSLESSSTCRMAFILRLDSSAYILLLDAEAVQYLVGKAPIACGYGQAARATGRSSRRGCRAPESGRPYASTRAAGQTGGPFKSTTPVEIA